ncbi:lipid-binding SYLF domain-containing protein [Phenylobacterium sp.]|jgi:lipid-binding SYLF domain-containing protein|uniref:lipid-binding SYLF domain-containing protein n=1 Tax=Phenylobacterium sp. TaxID=1871053 RepID=UPI002E2EFE08|nr:lipid-binding SYLF domain-containing protein [Phenylobacterium sp.]HEX4709103.1 lipid-binding SYLF domain-containing protein [Phenylobacterium sp.]
MEVTRRSVSAAFLSVACAFGPLCLTTAHADDREQLTGNALHSLHNLEASDPRAARLARRARAILVFPSVIKAGFVFGGETGNGVLLVNGQPQGFYNMSGGSWGLQIGAQDFSYALFFMTDGSLRYLHESAGFAAGSLPSLVVINKGAAVDVDTTTATHDVIAFPFNQKGLMANLTLEGTKITPIHPN